YGSKFDDVLVGGDGNDKIFGGKGNDLMVGGGGVDDLYTAYGDDAMVADALSFQNDVTKLHAALKDWNNKGLPLQKRVAKLLDGAIDDHKKDKIHYKSGKDFVIDAPVQQPVVKSKKK
ncbi:MAG TPA: hypothetical protein VH518_02840, partial [Tepidisphaeraceae bacterium]